MRATGGGGGGGVAQPASRRAERMVIAFMLPRYPSGRVLRMGRSPPLEPTSLGKISVSILLRKRRLAPPNPAGRRALLLVAVQIPACTQRSDHASSRERQDLASRAISRQKLLRTAEPQHRPISLRNQELRLPTRAPQFHLRPSPSTPLLASLGHRPSRGRFRWASKSRLVKGPFLRLPRSHLRLLLESPLLPIERPNQVAPPFLEGSTATH